ncbi:MAG: enzyme of heme biosynthesis [Alistipes senegalensis]|nr:enzyme of heme biosynthesis [Bacteroides cellulosilyticus]MCM1352652.1 enzyme of heme biosynthesis [Alistipes senegalensis]
MKNIRILLSVACVWAVAVSWAQDFSDPKYAKWGETPEERKENMMNSSFLKEEVANRNYDRAAAYFQSLVAKCPTATENIYVHGLTLYKNKINRAKTADEKRMFIDSLMTVYDLRLQHFGNHPTRGKAYVLDRKAREMVIYLPQERQAVRETFRAAIEAGGNATKPDLVVAYFANLCDDYKNTDEVLADEIIAEYDRMSAIFAENPAAADEKSQLDAAFGLSGAASCENLEKLFSTRLAAAPDDVDLLAQAVSLMSRAKCDSEFYFNTAEKYYAVKPSSETAMFLAQAFQNKRDFNRATKYLNEALASETDPVEREKLLVRIALVEMASNDMSGAAAAARQARDLNPEDGVPYFILAQCYAASAAACKDFAGQSTYWVAYDTMARAVELLQNDADYLPTAKQLLSSYRSYFPTNEELFFNEVKEGTRYTVSCGLASGIATTVRAR